MKDVKGYKGIYKITKDGRVWSAYRKRYLKGQLVKGYPLVDLLLFIIFMLLVGWWAIPLYIVFLIVGRIWLLKNGIK